jgi:hypothetical protein
MATQEQRKELEEKVTTLVATRLRGDYRAAFGHYDADGDGKIGPGELKTLLADAVIGSGLTRWAWAKGIMKAVDTPRFHHCPSRVSRSIRAGWASIGRCHISIRQRLQRLGK